MGKDTLKSASRAHVLLGEFLRLLEAFLPFGVEVTHFWLTCQLARGPRAFNSPLKKVLTLQIKPNLSIRLQCGVASYGTGESAHFSWYHFMDMDSEDDFPEALKMVREWLGSFVFPTE